MNIYKVIIILLLGFITYTSFSQNPGPNYTMECNNYYSKDNPDQYGYGKHEIPEIEKEFVAFHGTKMDFHNRVTFKGASYTVDYLGESNGWYMYRMVKNYYINDRGVRTPEYSDAFIVVDTKKRQLFRINKKGKILTWYEK